MRGTQAVLITGILLAGISSCKNEIATPPKIVYQAPIDNKKYKLNAPITLKASFYDKTGLATVKLFVNSVWKDQVVFADTEESLGGAESLDYTTTFVIDSLINYPKAAYNIKLTVSDLDGNVKTYDQQISLEP